MATINFDKMSGSDIEQVMGMMPSDQRAELARHGTPAQWSDGIRAVFSDPMRLPSGFATLDKSNQIAHAIHRVMNNNSPESQSRALVPLEGAGRRLAQLLSSRATQRSNSELIEDLCANSTPCFASKQPL